MNTIIDVKNLTKFYGSFKALDRVNFSIKKGEVLGFIGPNGAGKTTTIRVLLGLLKQTSGDATIFGKHVWDDSVEIHKRIAYVPGDVYLWPNLTGGEVIDFFTSISGGTDLKKKERLIKLFDLDPTKKCRTYSKGNRQKVALISAFASNAELVILDEPTSGLDPLMASIFQQCVLELKNEGKTVLMSSHILADVEKLCDRVVIIRKGRIIQTGTLDELRHMTENVVIVETEQPIKGLEKLKGISNLTVDKNKAHFQAPHAAIGDIIAHLSTFKIKLLNSTPPTLEELFMTHYGDDINLGSRG